MRIIRIPHDGPPQLDDITRDVTTYQREVGGYLEAIALERDLAFAVMWLNEEGKINDLPYNATATRLARLYCMGIDQNDYIVGNVFLTGPSNPDGDETDIDATRWFSLASSEWIKSGTR